MLPPLLLLIAQEPLFELLFSAFIRLLESSLILLPLDWVKEHVWIGMALVPSEPLLLVYNWPKSFSLFATELRLVIAVLVGIKL